VVIAASPDDGKFILMVPFTPSEKTIPTFAELVDKVIFGVVLGPFNLIVAEVVLGAVLSALTDPSVRAPFEPIKVPTLVEGETPNHIVALLLSVNFKIVFKVAVFVLKRTLLCTLRPKFVTPVNAPLVKVGLMSSPTNTSLFAAAV
jgi:hypothetical protein